MSTEKVELKLDEEWTDVTEHVRTDALADLKRGAEIIEDAATYCTERFSYPRAVYVSADAREQHIDADARSTATDRDFAMPWNAGYARGVSEGRRQAAEAIAYKIRAELVCCDIYEQLRPLRESEPSNYRDLFDAIDDHDLCYWGEASARIAESINEKDGTDG
jgi:hypothetical protein